MVNLSMAKLPRANSETRWISAGFYLSSFLALSFSVSADQSFNNESNLLVFIGTVSNYEEVPCSPEPVEVGKINPFSCFDAEVNTTFQILEIVHGDFKHNEIEVTSFDHFGRFPFLTSKYALMYVGKSQNRYFQHKYQFDPVYKTKDTRWAGCGAWPVNKTAHPDAIEKEPERVGFVDPPSFNLKEIAREWDTTVKDIQKNYDDGSFIIENDIATCIKGIYAEDLFELRNSTYLAARRKRAK